MAGTAKSRFVDGFPQNPAHPDYAVQAIIDSELRNCQALDGTRATPGLLYPAFFAVSRDISAAWLEPALRRFRWNAGRAPWDGYLRGLLRLLVSSSHPPASSECLLLLAQEGPELETNGGADCRAGEAIAAALKKRKAPLTAELIDALECLVTHLIGVHSHGGTTFDIAWRLWRADENPHDGAPCFSARVRADLRLMVRAEATLWRAFLDLRGSGLSLAEPSGGKLRAAIGRIGREAFAARWQGWMECLEANQPAVLSAAGRELLLLLLCACGSDTALAVDDGLYRLCGVRWGGEGNHVLTKEWLGALLMAVATRPAEKAFACAERLVHNPDTGIFVEVHTLYLQLLAEVAGEGELPRRREGVDGYDLMSEPGLYRHQLILDHCLRDALPGSNTTPGVVHRTWNADSMIPLLIRRQAEADYSNFVRAVDSRARWVNQTGRPAEISRHRTPPGDVEVRGPDPWLHWRVALRSVQQILLKAGPELSHDDLVTLIETDAAAPAGATTALLSKVESHTRRHGFTLRLVEAMERWHAAQRGSFAALQLRHRIGWLLWLEDVSSIREKDCWSQRIRRDVRAMPADARRAWMAILENTSFARTRRPSKDWEKRATTALAGVKTAEFRRRVRAWLEPLRAEQPLHLTVCGRDVLRNFMWYALVVQHPQMDAAIAWYAAAEWRNQRDRKCAEAILPAFVQVLLERSDETAWQAFETLLRKGKVALRGKVLDSYRELCARLGREPLPMATAKEAPAVEAGVLPMILKRLGDRSKVRAENGRIVVSGVRDTYEVDGSDGRIVRRSDGLPIRLELDFSLPAFAMLRPILDHADLKSPLRPSSLRLMLSIRVLLQDDLNQSSIVADRYGD